MIDVYWIKRWPSLHCRFSVCSSLVLTSPTQRTYLCSSAGSNSHTTKLKLTPPNSSKQYDSQDTFPSWKSPHVDFGMRQWKLLQTNACPTQGFSSDGIPFYCSRSANYRVIWRPNVLDTQSGPQSICRYGPVPLNPSHNRHSAFLNPSFHKWSKVMAYMLWGIQRQIREVT